MHCDRHNSACTSDWNDRIWSDESRTLGALSTVVVTPVAVAMDVGTVAVGILSIVSSRTGKYLAAKMDKHEKIRMLAETKLNTISSYISKALEGDLISDEEYSLICNEFEKFNVTKEEVRMKAKKARQKI